MPTHLLTDDHRSVARPASSLVGVLDLRRSLLTLMQHVHHTIILGKEPIDVFQRETFRLWEEQVYHGQEHKVQHRKDNVKLPADILDTHWSDLHHDVVDDPAQLLVVTCIREVRSQEASFMR
jgi:hypothetical protein